MKKHLLIFFLMAFSVFCFAAESENISVPNNAIGFSYTSGTEEFMNMGITYQQWFDNSLGFSCTIGGTFQKDSEIAITTLFDLQKKFLTNYFQKSDITTILFGWMGIQWFISGRAGMGCLYLFTLGLFGFGWIVDSIRQIVAFTGQTK